jgi:DNA (cytosine-5)-methyltransferase 1
MLDNYSVIDLFCGVGGLSHGLLENGFKVTAGIDLDISCRYAFEQNNKGAKFYPFDVSELSVEQLETLFPKDKKKILVGCAPCQPFSLYNKKRKNITDIIDNKGDGKWRLLDAFADLIIAIQPEIISMENVMSLRIFDNGSVLQNFKKKLENEGYTVSDYDVNVQDYGIPQRRKRLVLFGTKYNAKIEIMKPTHSKGKYVTVREALKGVPKLDNGATHPKDKLHHCRLLGDLNLRRIKATREGGFWREWSEDLKLDCHKKEGGKSFRSVYGRMSWDDVAPTMTTYCIGLGNGRFGHPEEDRAISLREAAIFQNFPRDYDFIDPNVKFSASTLARQIGNAVPVGLGRVIGESIKKHLEQYGSKQ